MSENEEQRAILSSAAYWDTPLGSSQPDCNAIPTAEMEHTKEVSEDTRRVMAYSAMTGVRIFDRLEDESFADFRARIDEAADEPED